MSDLSFVAASSSLRFGGARAARGVLLGAEPSAFLGVPSTSLHCVADA